jgi:alpha-mannosidase
MPFVRLHSHSRPNRLALMTYEDLFVLIPSHSLEDFPVEIGDDEAEGLLNAFAVLWHPRLLAHVDALPSWHRSDEPPEALENRLVIIPENSKEWLPGGWAGHARLQGAVVLEGMKDRAEMVRAALGPLESESDPDAGSVRVTPEINPDLVADFHALGTCWLMVELLTTHMHHFSNLDELELQHAAIAAAQAAVAGDDEAARSHLRRCFETLQEARERFYPVDCYLVDLCLLIPRQANEYLDRALDGETPFNLLLSAADLRTIAEQKPQVVAAMREAWDAGRLDVAGGELQERPTPLLPIGSVLWDFQQGQRTFQELLGRTPTTWGRRRFGFTTTLPQILNKLGYVAALHVALDDGIYPDAEQSRIRWEGCDGTVVDAVTRIPLAALSAGSYLRFPQRMAESMEEDHVAAVIFARWPEMNVPWFDDFQRIHRYAPVLGRFVTFEEFFDQTEDPGRLSNFEAGEYFGPFLLQSVALQEADPLSRYARHVQLRHRFESAAFFAATASLLGGVDRGESPEPPEPDDVERLLEAGGPDVPGSDGDAAACGLAPAEVEAAVDGFHAKAAGRLAGVILGTEPNQAKPQAATPGFLVLNPLAFQRRVVLDFPEMESPPAQSPHVKGTQFDDFRRLVSLDLPPCGFVWLPSSDQASRERERPETSGPSLAEDDVLRNEFFEVWINDATGGIGRIKEYGRKPNRLSQQVAFRFREERAFTVGEGAAAERERSYYSEMRCRSLEIKSTGPLLGEIETTGDIVDQTNGGRLAGFQQTVRMWRGLPLVEVELTLDPDHLPEGDPWTSYYGLRFAYNDLTAAVTRSVQQGAQGFQGQRFDSLHYIEIATEEQRTTIAVNGHAFHRKTGPRMFDTLLVAAGETQRRFKFRIALDVDYPMQPALDLLCPPAVVPVDHGPPAAGDAGWFFHLSAKNVQILKLIDLASRERQRPEDDHQAGFLIRLLETEGRGRRTKLRCFRTPSSARHVDFQGRTIHDLMIEGDAVIVEMSPHEIADVEVRWEE